ncbi:hypothetical protein LJY25_06310 [Hymenobacter sp. BT175]|uniref:hypothetical protein n=1 Tax=Hymenobacter translucens TaxID=2886507 RepID=UPI001D0E9C7D|nr:hypothetical protein [Hymenobacter translucens]MCC2546051.1 hypothetical protein [Hymenobacter translucens]
MRFYLILTLLLTSGWRLFAQQPAFTWGRAVGGTGEDVLRGIGNDAQGNTYLTGTFERTLSLGSTSVASVGATDIVLAKLTRAGHVRWVRAFGSPGFDYTFDLDSDASGNLYVTGAFRSGFTLGGQTYTSRGSADLFTAKFDSAGSVQWVRTGGGTAFDSGNEVAVSPAGAVLVIGNYYGPMQLGTVALPHQDSSEVLVAKYSDAGQLQWVNTLTGPGHAQGRGISADAQDNVVVTGEFTGTLQVGNVTLVNPSTTTRDVFVAKYTPGGQLLWARRYGGPGEDYGRGVDCDAQGNLYCSGVFTGALAVDALGLSSTAGSRDLYLLKLDPGGAATWARQFGGPGSDEGCEIEVDAGSGAAYLSGGFSATAAFGFVSLTAVGQRDIVALKVDRTGAVQWARASGGAADDVAYALCLDRSREELTAVGTFTGTFRQDQTTFSSAGGVDSYVSRLGPITLTATQPAVPAMAFQAFPNPIAAGQPLHLRLPAAVGGTYVLLDGLGQVRATGALTGTEPLVSTTGLGAGMYVLCLARPGWVAERRVIVVQ